MQLQFLATHLALAGQEIILRQFHLLTVNKCVELLVEELEVQCIQRLVIIFALLIKWRLLTVKEIVVE